LNTELCMPENQYKFDKESLEALRRLRLLEHFEDSGTIACLEQTGVGTGWRCLEAGAGSGSIAIWLAERVGPGGLVVATDLDTRFLEPLRAPNLEPRRHDLVADSLETGAFDLVHCRFVLTHIPGQEAVMKKMGDAVRPGGWIMVEEPDMTTDRPAPGAPEEIKALYTKVTSAIFAFLLDEGVDPYTGSRIGEMLHRLGFGFVQSAERERSFRGGTPNSKSPHMQAFAQVRTPVAECSGISERKFDEFFALAERPEFGWHEGRTVSVWGRRPQ